MTAVLSILIILGSIFMIIMVLLQPGKGDLSATFGGVSSQLGSMFGMSKTKNILESITRWIAVGLLVLVLIFNKFYVGQVQTVQQVKPATEGAKAPINNIAPPPVETPKK